MVGLQELYNFKQQNPQADLEPFLAKSSTYFREYIERGLRNVEQEVRGGGGGAPAPPSSTNRGSVLSDSNTTGQPAHMVYLERLKRLRAAGGLETADQENMEHIRENIPSAGQQTNTSSGYSSGVNSAYSRNANTYTSTEITYQSNQVESSTATNERSTSDATSVDEIRKRLAKIKQAAF